MSIFNFLFPCLDGAQSQAELNQQHREHTGRLRIREVVDYQRHVANEQANRARHEQQLAERATRHHWWD